MLQIKKGVRKSIISRLSVLGINDFVPIKRNKSMVEIRNIRNISHETEKFWAGELLLWRLYKNDIVNGNFYII